MSEPFRDRVIVVTGGFGSLGRAVGTRLLSQGARVALLDRTCAGIEAEEGGLLRLGGVDIGQPEAAQAAMASVLAQWGRIDALVNVAGGFAWETIAEGALDTWDRMYAMNLRSTVSATRAALPHLLAGGGGRIVNIGAQAALKAVSGMGAYTASKAGVMRLTEALAEELKDQGINVNAVLPSVIDTPANRADMPHADFARWVTPQALASVVSFLLSDESAAVTGACLPVSGRV